ncbi:hypothetical protein G7085_06190 [Tessaracoccus sp. HDW20]|uniref:hypothetical protein n=1 Tax=Tessaracoccus coleopterorum TaxID=2714950 RepID=UPI0018D406EB|nr:hypothetical protein [Tessaracoccus coleopterorum]NHB84334.1 hypothetical protein [Tessaracoccus coleopterorum]
MAEVGSAREAPHRACGQGGPGWAARATWAHAIEGEDAWDSDVDGEVLHLVPVDGLRPFVPLTRVTDLDTGPDTPGVGQRTVAEELPASAGTLRGYLDDAAEVDGDGCWPVVVIGTPRRGASIAVVSDDGSLLAEVSTGPRSPLAALRLLRTGSRRPGTARPDRSSNGIRPRCGSQRAWWPPASRRASRT